MASNFDQLLKLGLLEEDESLPPAPLLPEPRRIDPAVREHVMKKRMPAVENPLPEEGAVASKPSLFDKFQEEFGDEAYKKARSQAEDEKSGTRWLQFGSAIGDAIAGRNPSQSAAIFQDIRKGIDADTVGSFEKRKSAFGDNLKNQKALEDMDPNSASSKAFRKSLMSTTPGFAKAYGEDFDSLTAADVDKVFKFVQMREMIEGRKDAARALAGQRAEARQAKQEEKEFALQTPYGLANTADDAKQLKAAHEAKKNFDNKLQQMIELRESKGGGDMLDRDAVARGKQLSKDLLLEYKNMAKLGVLSQADEAIINAIIPDDPLKFRSPYEAIAGQDSVLTKLKGFQGDSNKDFQTRVQTRTRDGIKSAGQKRPIRREENKKTGQTRIVYDDGTFEIEPSVAGR